MEWFVYLGVAAAAVALESLLLRRRGGRREEELVRLADCVRLPIANVRDGQVARVAGELKLMGEPLRAPLSGRACAYYEVYVEEWEGGEDPYCWAVRHFDWDARDFLIEDDSGRALIHQEQPDVLLDMDRKVSPMVYREPPSDLSRYLEQLKASPLQPVIDWGRAVVREGVLEAGELINARGLCRWEADSAPQSYREAARRLVVTAPPGGELLVTDKKL